MKRDIEKAEAGVIEAATDGAAIGTRLTALAGAWAGSGARIEAVERLSGGASQEIWAFEAVGANGRRPLILRRLPGGGARRESAAGMETEARLIRLAVEAGAPAPTVVHVCEPADGLGSGYVMERVPGETLARKLLRDPEYAAARERLARQLGEAAAHIHGIDVTAAEPLRHTRIQSSLDDAAARYRAYRKPRPVFELALRWLTNNRPARDATPAVVHGDMRTGNVVVGPEGLRAVLDWEVVHIGDPMEDLAWMCVPSWRFGAIDKPAGGFGSRDELYAGYESVSGATVDPARVRFWEVLGVLRWGLSCAMMGHEFLNGEGSVEKAAIGRRVSETEIDLLAMLAPGGGFAHA